MTQVTTTTELNTPSPHTTVTSDKILPDDATWLLTSAFIIFTMQSGFGLLEAGLVSRKNETNIMVKNAIDVIYGGLAYWMFGFAISFGEAEKSNWFTGWGCFFVDSDENNMGLFAKYFFQLSFATTATTIVSGAMAERVEIKAYTAFSFFNIISYAFPAHWMWNNNGFLKEMGVVDVAGCGPVHLVGGVAGLVATVMLRPRKNKFDENGKSREMAMASPTNVLLGTFMLWWGWLGFNCGSTFGTSGDKWKIASRSAVVTINGSVGGGIFGMVYRFDMLVDYSTGRMGRDGIVSRAEWAVHFYLISAAVLCCTLPCNGFFVYKKKLIIKIFVTGILGGLVGVTAICAVCRPWEALLIGAVGGAVASVGLVWEERLHIDDPVGAFPTHALASIWGLIATALFCEPTPNFAEYSGIFKGGPWKFFGIQLLAAFSCSAWSAITTFVQLFIIDNLIGLRMTDEQEEVGADYDVHSINMYQEDSVSLQKVNTPKITEVETYPLRGSGTSRLDDLQIDSMQHSVEVESSSDIDTNKLREINSPAKVKIRTITVSSSFNQISPSKSSSGLGETTLTPEGTSNSGFQSS